MPSKKKWVADTHKALYGSRTYVRDRVAKGGTKLALNLDIDNTSLATYYAPGKPVPVTLRLVKYAKSKGVYILFNTGRARSAPVRRPSPRSSAPGFPVDGLCARYKGESLTHSKQRCRQSFVNNGFTIIANVGNRSTDFVGGTTSAPTGCRTTATGSADPSTSGRSVAGMAVRTTFGSHSASSQHVF